MESGAANGPLRAGGKAKAEYLLTRAGVIGREGDGPSVLSGRESGKQGGTADSLYVCPCSPLGERGLFLLLRRCFYETADKTMAGLKMFPCIHETRKHKLRTN